MLKKVGVMILALALCGCVPSMMNERGSRSLANVTPEQLNAKLIKGVTTKSDVERMFGEPDSIHQDSLMDSWMYSYQGQNAFSLDYYKSHVHKHLSIMWDKNGKLSSWNYGE